MCAELGVKVPGHCQVQLSHTLKMHLLKTHLFWLFQILEVPGPHLAPSFMIQNGVKGLVPAAAFPAPHLK